MTPAELARLAEQSQRPGPWLANHLPLIGAAADPAVVKAWLALREAAIHHICQAAECTDGEGCYLADALAVLDAALAAK